MDSVTYVWSIRLITNITTGFVGYFDGDVTIAGVFEWCLPIAPTAPVLDATSTAAYDAAVSFSWDPVNFGKTCDSSSESYTIYLYQNISDVLHLSSLSPSSCSILTIASILQAFYTTVVNNSFVYDPVIYGPLDSGVWFWVVSATLSSTVTSATLNFTVQPPAPFVCTPACVHGTCNITLGRCSCASGYSGASCSESDTGLPSRPPPTTHLNGFLISP